MRVARRPSPTRCGRADATTGRLAWICAAVACAWHQLAPAAVPAGSLQVAAAATPVPISVRIRQKQALLEATQRKLQAGRLRLHQARFRELTIAQQLAAVQSSISRVENDLGALDRQIRKTELRLAIRRRQLAAAEASLNRHRDALNRRIVDVYEYGGDQSYLGVLLNATSFVDFIERWDFVRDILQADARLIATVNAEQANDERLVAALDATRTDLVDARQEQERRREQLSALAVERRRLLAVASYQRSMIAQQVTELENLTAAQEARLEALIREKQREDALAALRARLAAAQARRMAAIAAGLPPPMERETGPVVFAWPVRGPITSPFGYRLDPFTGRYALHTGIDIGADYGAPIEAAADGVVIFVGWYGGYGNAIVIDHTSGLSTLYAHCSMMYVTVNQAVQRGQVIGAVGATGWATGPHLHFEIRVNGVPVDPLSRL